MMSVVLLSNQVHGKNGARCTRNLPNHSSIQLLCRKIATPHLRSPSDRWLTHQKLLICLGEQIDFVVPFFITYFVTICMRIQII